MSMHLSIVSPEQTIYDGEADKVLVPGVKGAFEILVNHAPIISSLQQGKLAYSCAGEEFSIEVKNGFVEVLRNEVSVCVTV